MLFCGRITRMPLLTTIGVRVLEAMVHLPEEATSMLGGVVVIVSETAGEGFDRSSFELFQYHGRGGI